MKGKYLFSLQNNKKDCKTLNYKDMIKVIKKQAVRIAYSTAVLLMGIASFGLIVQGCSQDDDTFGIQISENEKSLNLTAPNGEEIAKSIFHLKEIVSVSVAEKYGIDKEFHITSLEYAPIKEGYAVLIKYKTSDNLIGGIIRTNSHSFAISPGMKVLMSYKTLLKSNRENSAILNGVTITCTPLDDNCAECSCMPSFKVSAGSSTVTHSCVGTPSSTECVMEMTNNN
jgi:hypothetical protein